MVSLQREGTLDVSSASLHILHAMPCHTMVQYWLTEYNLQASICVADSRYVHTSYRTRLHRELTKRCGLAGGTVRS
jgi:hypothetical protein